MRRLGLARRMRQRRQPCSSPSFWGRRAAARRRPRTATRPLTSPRRGSVETAFYLLLVIGTIGFFDVSSSLASLPARRAAGVRREVFWHTARHLVYALQFFWWPTCALHGAALLTLAVLYAADVVVAWSDVWEETASRKPQGRLAARRVLHPCRAERARRLLPHERGARRVARSSAADGGGRRPAEGPSSPAGADDAHGPLGTGGASCSTFRPGSSAESVRSLPQYVAS